MIEQTSPAEFAFGLTVTLAVAYYLVRLAKKYKANRKPGGGGGGGGVDPNDPPTRPK